MTKIYFYFLALWILSQITILAQDSNNQIVVRVTEGVKAKVAVANLQNRDESVELAQSTQIFNDVLWNDLELAGVFELIPKSFYPLKLPSQPYDVKFEEWVSEDVGAQNLVYGNSYLQNNQFVVEGRLVDVNTQESIIGNRYRVEPN